ncbi:MAG: SUMF1/EgtB/PvdO family nonheme iron enzyme [Pseudomonadota bacterium]
MSRLFISHSSKDNVFALAFRNWLMSCGWSKEDIFRDLHGIGAGERWREKLRAANVLCEAVLLLASPDSLDSIECQREMNLAEDLGKEIIVAILRDLKPDDPRLARWADRQFIDLSAEPQERMEPFEHDGQLHRVHFHMPALNAIAARLSHLGIAPGSFAWQPRDGKGPYPGLAAFAEDDAGIFFGRDADIVAGLTDLRTMRKRHASRLLIVVAASGAGKSSYLRAGLWPRLKRDTDYAPLAILRPAQGILTGPDGLGRKLAPWFDERGHTVVAGDINAALAEGDGTAAAAELAQLLAQATGIATTIRRTGAPDARPPAPILAIDQGEELFAAENLSESERFLTLLAQVLKHPPAEVDPYILVTIRADSVEALLQRWPALGLEAPQSRYLPPMAPAAYRSVITEPAKVYTNRVRRLDIEPALVERLVDDAHGADALPLLAFTLERLFGEFGADGDLTLARYESMGGIGGSIDRALTEAKAKAGTAGSDDNLRRLIIPALATWDPAADAAKRLVADEAALLAGNRAQLAPLADSLVATRLLTRGAGTLEVAHEALLRRAPIAGWLAAQKDKLKLRDDVLREATEWRNIGRHDKELVRRGVRLEAAHALERDDDFATALAPAADYLAACTRQEAAARRRVRRTQAAIFTLMAGVIAALTGVIYKEPLLAFAHQVTVVRPYIAKQITPHLLTAERERSLKPGDTFRECASACPEMVVIPAGSFTMGSPPGEKGRQDDEGPQRQVTLAAFAAAKHEVTFDDYEECVRLKGCVPVSDSGYGRGLKPVINISWDEASQYVAWLARITGKPYRLLTEAEWEYAARAGAATVYSFGDDERELCKHANFADAALKAVVPDTWVTTDFCNDGHTVTAPVGRFTPNAFGLYDMHGNVQEWTQDCYVNSYQGAPTDGSVRQTGECKQRVARGGSWDIVPRELRAADRSRNTPDFRNSTLGFRVGRSVIPPRTL